MVVNYTRNADEAKKVVAGIEAMGVKAVAVQADVGKVSDVRRLFQETDKAFGRLDILINNAGIFWAKPMADVTENEYDQIFAINTKGQFFAMQEAAKRMADGGCIVNISTGATRIDEPLINGATEGDRSLMLSDGDDNGRYRQRNKLIGDCGP